MSQQEQGNEALARRFHMDIFQTIASDFVWRNPIIPPELQRGPESVKKIASQARDATQDLQISHDDTMAKGDKVMIRWTLTGTAKRELFGISPSDKPTSVIDFDLFRISSEGKIVELRQQLGVGNGHSG